MADEKVMTPTAASPVASNPASDGNKRKLEDMELKDAPESISEFENKSDPESLNNVSQEDGNVGVDESDTKRPRLENNGDNVADAEGQVAQNGHQEEGIEDKPVEENLKQPEAKDNTDQPVENSEPMKETEYNTGEIAEPLKETEYNAGEPAEDQEPVSVSEPNDNEKTDIESVDRLEQPNVEVEESSELPREGDVPIDSDERQAGSGAQILSRQMEVPNDKVGVLIGKAGDTIKSLQDNSGAKIQITRDADADPRSSSRPVELVGTLESINKAEKLIKNVIAEADAGGSPSLVARGFSTVQAASGGEQLEIQVPGDKVGLIIGKGGETIRNLQTRSGARIQLIQQNLPDGEQSRERTVRVTGNKKQVDTAREMIKDVMNQTVRPSPLSSGYSQQNYRPRGPVAPQWGPRGPHHGQYSGYDYPQRGSYPSQNSQYHPSYGNYPPPQAPRSNYGPSWEQRPPASIHGPSPQGNYNYEQHIGPDYTQSTSYSQAPSQPYGHGYNEAKYDHHAPSQHYGHMGSQPTPYGQGGPHSGYGPQDPYGKPPVYGMQAQVPHSQPYGQPRPSQPGDVPYQGPTGSAPQSYAQNTPQQFYPYASSAAMQQNYAPYGSTTDGYGHTLASAYHPQSGQPVAGYSQPGAQQQPAYGQVGATGGYSMYPAAQAGYAEQPAASSATYGYQGQTDPSYGTTQGSSAYPTPGTGQSGYAQPSQTQPTYDQSGGYGTVAAAGAYGKSASPQPAAYPQYDSNSQMYGAHR